MQVHQLITAETAEEALAQSEWGVGDIAKCLT